ncbi:Ring assembly protein 3 [Ceratocystis fimbriata CBS 114723]|uniref:Ring assembly protein 3 n=1 Tax=Ceratocystis fimbriata CBS 114723 TaxID=1035309 RepID=A0A2C5XFZ7_9PEZI|nr:Ring assembly protein 3 [Ceratocystis fimbriata CBS 114723]
MASVAAAPAVQYTAAENDTQLIIARLMEGGQEDEETCQDLDRLTKYLSEDKASQSNKDYQSLTRVVDIECVDTLLGYLDMRQPDTVRGHATLTMSAYFQAAGEQGAENLKTFFFGRVNRGTYDDYIVAFCVAGAAFPVVPDVTAELFLKEGFLSSLGPLIRRKWKSRKVETACLEMLNAACMNSVCRDAVQKYCVEWLDEIVDQDPEGSLKPKATEPQFDQQEGSISMRRHSQQVQKLAAVILAKLQAIATPPSNDPNQRVTTATISIEDLSTMFTGMLVDDDRDKSHGQAVEGLAYASLRPQVKETLSRDSKFLQNIIKELENAPPRSPLTYGALSILANLTRYRPILSDEEQKMNQLKAYANAAGKLAAPNPLDDDSHVEERCKRVFEAGVVPVLVTHSKNGSPASLLLVANIMNSLASDKTSRGKLAQQGAIRLLLGIWATLPKTQEVGRYVAAHALARILISTNPSMVFGGNSNISQHMAIPPLVTLMTPDESSGRKNLLPTFEGLMALTNLASMNNMDTHKALIQSSWDKIEDLMLANNPLICKATVELVCNLVQSPEGIALYADGSPQAKNRLHIMLALADAEDEGIRSAAGGALASLSNFDGVIDGILSREKGLRTIIGMCDEENEDLRHRAAVILYNMLAADSDAGKRARKRVQESSGVQVLMACAKTSRRPEVIEVIVSALKILLENKET